MAETRTRTIRVDDEVWAAIQALPGRTQNEAMRQLLIEGGSSIENKIDELRELILTLPNGAVKSEISGEFKVEDSRPKNAYCKHCGSRFAGQRFATICSDCKASGHTLTPAECPVCGEGRGI